MQHTTCNIGYAICDMQLATLLFIHRSNIAAVRTPTKFYCWLLLIIFLRKVGLFPLIKINNTSGARYCGQKGGAWRDFIFSD